MKQLIKNIQGKFPIAGYSLIILITLMSFASCEDNTLPEIGSIPDLTPPMASFSVTQGIGANDEWKSYTFSNESSGAINYLWEFGDGNTSTEFEPMNAYPGEGTFTAKLTASDLLGVESVFTLTFDIVEPIAIVIPDPVLVNADFNKIPKSSGSDCTCSGWINKSVGDQGESSSGNGGSDNVLKFDNNEPDHVYQEFAVTPNADYTITIVASFKSLVSGGSFPSMLEMRVLEGSGYKSGYTPMYYATAVEYPQDNFGYETIASVEDVANNALTEVIPNPGNTSYNTYTYTFNSGNNTSAALFIRGIGGPSAGGGGGSFGYNSGDEEIRVDNVVITAN